MNPLNHYIPLILSGVLLNAAAQIFIKHGMRAVGKFAFTLSNLVPIGLKVSANPCVLSGMACYAVSIVVWLMVLSRVDVSYAYPLLSIGYVVTAVAGKILFGETVGFDRCAGIVMICIGVYLITRSG